MGRKCTNLPVFSKGVTPGGTPIFNLNGYVPLIVVWFSGSWVLKYRFEPVLLDPPCVDTDIAMANKKNYLSLPVIFLCVILFFLLLFSCR